MKNILIAFIILFVTAFPASSYMIDADVGRTENIIEAGMHPTMLLNTDCNGTYFSYERTIAKNTSMNIFCQHSYYEGGSLPDMVHNSLSLNMMIGTWEHIAFAGSFGIYNDSLATGGDAIESGVDIGIEGTITGLLNFIPSKSTAGIYAYGRGIALKIQESLYINDSLQIPIAIWSTYDDRSLRFTISGIRYYF